MTGDYNDILYPSYLATQCSPDQLSAMARMKGLDTAHPNQCRMLELGCGDGASLIAYAYALPGSRFVGVDLAARPIEIGNAKIAQLGLKNVTLHCGDVMNMDESYGEFDFIFAHGLFSWVPDPVRERVLELSERLLAPGGVVYLSYNAYPGSFQRDMLRAMMQIHTRHVTAPGDKLRQALGLIDFIRSAPFRDSPYHHYIDVAKEHQGKVPPETLLYDELGSVNQAFFFHEFASLAGRFDLQFLNEAHFDQTLPALAPQLKQALESLGNDVITLEQYLDFLTGRAFRQTMLCHAGVQLDHRRRWQPLRELYIAAPAIRKPSQETDPPGSVRFAGMHGRSAAVSDPGVQRALEHLGAVWPAIVSFEDLSLEAAGGDTEVLGEHLLQFAEGNFVRIHAHSFHLAPAVSEKPRASALARRQLGERFLVNLFCEAVSIGDPLGRLVFAHLDGTRTKGDLAVELDAILADQRTESEEVRRQIAEARAHLPEAIDKQLKDIFELGLLEA